MPLNADDINALTQITTGAARGAVAEAMLPVQRELAEIKGRLDQGKATMGEHREELKEHDGRLDGHDYEIANLKPRPRAELTPAAGQAALTKRRSRFIETMVTETISMFARPLVPLLLIAIGSLLTNLGPMLTALGHWLARVTST